MNFNPEIHQRHIIRLLSLDYSTSGAYFTTKCTENLSELIPNEYGIITRGEWLKTSKIRETPFMPVWQRNYYEHIIRYQNELTLCRKYFLENPQNYDKKHPDQIPGIIPGG